MGATTRREGRQAGGAAERRLGVGEEPPLAAHLVSPRRLYTHHGLYVGGGRVIHYAGFGVTQRAGPIEEVSLEDFAAGNALAVRVSASLHFGPEQVVRRARSRLGERRYRVLTNNCEHLCEWALRGRSRSGQIESWLAPARQARQLARDALSRLGLAPLGRTAHAG